jgi:D-alanyl-D-alanine carboxypeptidase
VTLNDPNDWADHSALLEAGFGRYTVQRIVNSGDVVGTREVESGQGDRVEILAAEDLDYPLSGEERPLLVLPGPGFVYSPVTEGADAGYVYLVLDGNAVEKIPVVYGRTVERETEPEPGFFEKIFGRKLN